MTSFTLVCNIRFFPGFGCDTESVITILAHRDATQRGFIQHEYRTLYGEDMLKRLSKELSGKLEVYPKPTIAEY